MIGAPADLAVSKVPGGIDEGATKIAKEAVDQLYRMLAGQDLQGDLKRGLIMRRYRCNPVATFFRGKCGRSMNINMNMIVIS
jgi:hypothetical protein